MASQIKIRRGTKQQWINAYPIILAIGEPGLELDTRKVKHGDGSTEWQALAYSSEPLPNKTGNAGKYLTVDGNGVLSWVSITDDDSNYITTGTLGHFTFTNNTLSVTDSNSISLTTNSKSWGFGSDGKTTFPGYSFPAADGTGGQILTTNGNGTLSWTTVAGLNLGNYVFVDDTILNTNNITLTSGSQNWTFGTDGILNLPNSNGQIGQLEAPYTGLEFRAGSGSDWVGISYGEIEDNNTSYFYFDKDGSDYTTANHLAHLQIKNPTHDGHVQWLFDSSGTLTLPQNATVADTGNSVVITPNHLASDFQLEIKAYDDVVTPDDIHIRANNNNYGLTLGDSNGGSYILINGDLHDNEVIVSTINKNNEERKEFVFDVLGNLHVPGDVQVSSVGAFKNSNGIRAAYITEVPTDISQLTDNSGMISSNQQSAEINIDGGHALAFFAPQTSADGGGSAGRFGPNSIVFNGGGASGGIYDTVLNGGGA